MKKWKILVAPNAFKGSMSSMEAATCIGEGLSAFPQFEVALFPIADGGDGTLEVWAHHLNGQLREAKVCNPLGAKINARWGYLKSGTALIEMTEASGVKLLKKQELDPLRANTYGTGQLVAEALEAGCKEIMIGVGGSATVDAGAGILQALGGKFLSNKGNEIKKGNLLMEVDRMDLTPCREKLNDINITILSDVKNPLLGARGAAKVFGPQKGADTEAVEKLERKMKKFSELVVAECGSDFTDMEGAGAAGGIPFTIKSLFGAKVISGMDFLFEKTKLTDLIQNSDLIITGEGKIDSQTLDGKGPGKIAECAKSLGKVCIGICGTYQWQGEMEKYFDFLLPINQGKPFDEKMRKDTPGNLAMSSRQLGRLLSAIGNGKAL